MPKQVLLWRMDASSLPACYCSEPRGMKDWPGGSGLDTVVQGVDGDRTRSLHSWHQGIHDVAVSTTETDGKLCAPFPVKFFR